MKRRVETLVAAELALVASGRDHDTPRIDYAASALGCLADRRGRKPSAVPGADLVDGSSTEHID